MISTDLHAHNYFIGLASNHGAESGNGFGKCKGCATMQNTERLTGAMVYGHGCFYAIFRSVGVLDAQVAHQGMACLCV